jgi:hypothetical protein
VAEFPVGGLRPSDGYSLEVSLEELNLVGGELPTTLFALPGVIVVSRLFSVDEGVLQDLGDGEVHVGVADGEGAVGVALIIGIVYHLRIIQLITQDNVHYS